MKNLTLSVTLAFALIATVLGVSPTPAAAESPFIDTNDREAVEDAFQILADTIVPSGWNGNINTCNAGTTSQSYRDATLEQLNVHRALAGLSPLTEDASLTPKAQEAALIVAANGYLDHTPSSNSACYSSVGADASYNSNLGIGIAGPEAVGSYVNDGNLPGVGHRRVVLNPNSAVAGLGAIPVSTSAQRSDAIWVETHNLTQRPMRSAERLVAWPTEGYFINTMYSPRWSVVSDNGVDFSGASVSVTVDGSPVPVTVEVAGGNYAVWMPQINIDHDRDQQVVTTINHSSGNIVYTTTLIPMPDGNGVENGSAWDNSQFIINATTIDQIVHSYDYDVNRHGEILRLYRAFFNREPDVGGAKYWLTNVAPFHTNTQIAGFFSGSDEFHENYSGVNDAEYLTRVYANVLGRGYDQGGYDYWLDILQGTNITGHNPDLTKLDRAGVVFYVGLSPEFKGQYPYDPAQ